VGEDGKLPLTEILIDTPGPASPFGDIDFPLPPERLRYRHQ
jgi:hypothetical protein